MRKEKNLTNGQMNFTVVARWCQNKKAISDGFNNFLTNISLMLAKQIKHCHNTSFSDFMSNSVHISLFLEPVIGAESLRLFHL